MQSSPTTRLTLLAAGLMLLTAWSAGPEGRWEGTFTTPHGDQPLALELSYEGSTWRGHGVAGTTDLAAGSELLDLEIRGDSIAFGLEITTGMGPAVMHFSGAVTSVELSGTYDMNIESMAMPMRGRWRTARK
jgi:hypothetical protein